MITNLSLLLAMLAVLTSQTNFQPLDPLVTQITAMMDSSVSLPCNMTSNTPGDKVKLVLWFREDKMTPVYSLDSRGKNVDLHHWLTKRFAWQINQRITTLIISQTLVTKSLCHSLKSDFRMTTPSRR